MPSLSLAPSHPPVFEGQEENVVRVYLFSLSNRLIGSRTLPVSNAMAFFDRAKQNEEIEAFQRGTRQVTQLRGALVRTMPVFDEETIYFGAVMSRARLRARAACGALCPPAIVDSFFACGAQHAVLTRGGWIKAIFPGRDRVFDPTRNRFVFPNPFV